MTHVWYDDAGGDHSSRLAADAVDSAMRAIADAQRSIDEAWRTIDESLELVEAVAAHERFAEYELAARERLDALLLRASSREGGHRA